ncbi:hypothetical protein ACOSQ2_023291 [Xanthoceras sorbifolium]
MVVLNHLSVRYGVVPLLKIFAEAGLNLNVALDSSRSLVGVRLVLRDDERRVLGSSWQCFSGNLFPLDAEGATVLRGLQFALDVGVSFIVVESDASSLVGFINDKVMSFSEIGLVVVEIQKLCLNFQNYLVIFGAMKVNWIAHSLTKLALVSVSDSFFIDANPLSVSIFSWLFLLYISYLKKKCYNKIYSLDCKKKML